MSQITWDFSGKRVLVTGGGTGIGLAIGTEFARAGAEVVPLGRNKAALDEAVESLSGAGAGRVSSEVCDLTDPQEIARTARAVTERLGGIDILVNNAGVGGSVPFPELTDHEVDLNLNANLRATILLTRDLIAGMLERGNGVVINISSQAGKARVPGDCALQREQGRGHRFHDIARCRSPRRSMSTPSARGWS
jgi:NAD(P)-dependent dehydrogenase (short-subunit alcohol dehydrogenase family)